MKKRLFAIAALSVTMAVTSIPVHAAEIEPVKQGDGYAVYVGQGIESLQETLKALGINIDFGGSVCPVIPEQPDTEEPDTEIPDTETPDIEEPDTEEPDTETPDTETPDAETPDTEEPDTETPDTEVPVQPDKPDTEQPDTDISDDGETALHAYARQVVTLVNEERAKAGLPEVKLDMDITAAANVRAREIKQSFSHTRPDGSSFSTVLQQQGISYRGSGENIAWGQRTPEQVMEGWMNSEGHRANILNKNFKNIGVGFYQENGVNYWVQLFTY